MNRLLAIVLALSATPALADQRGNGGDVVVCHDAQGAITTVELLDFYEGRSRLGFQVDLASGATWQEKLAGALAKIAVVDPDRAASYRDFAARFEVDTHFWAGVELTDIPDSAHIAIPRGCAIAQIAIQREPTFPEEKYYTVSKDLWELLDEAGKAGLVLHEIVFREALARGHANSIQTRYYNALVTSRGFSPQRGLRYIAVTKQMTFSQHTVGAHGLVFKINEYLQWNDDGTLESGQLAMNGRWTLPNGLVIGLLAPTHNWVGGPTFHANGQLASANLVDETVFPLSEGDSVTSIARYGVSFDEAGRLTGAHLGLTPTTFAIGGYTVTLTHNVDVHEGRYVVGGYLKENLDVTLCGRTLSLKAPVMIAFDPTRTYLAYLGDVDEPTPLCFRNPATGATDDVVIPRSGITRFDAEGVVTSIHVGTGTLVRTVQGLPLNLFGTVTFHANGGVAKALLDQNQAQLRTTAGTLVIKNRGANLAFDEAGLLAVP